MRAAQIIPSRADAGRDDGELVLLASKGDRWAREALFGRYVRPVIRRLTRLLGDPEEAADLAQDTFLVAYAKLHRLKNPNAFEAWLMQIAVRRAHDALRRRKLRRLLGLYQPRSEGLAALATTDATAEQRAELALLDRTLARLSAADRIAWTLRYVEGERLEDVARMTSCSLATAKRRIKRAQEHVSRHVSMAEEGAS
ncbi:MAG: RNA polymerase sigma factor [Deltaproteobacteria bacterium]